VNIGSVGQGDGGFGGSSCWNISGLLSILTGDWVGEVSGFQILDYCSKVTILIFYSV